MTKKCFLMCFLLVLAMAVDAFPAPLNPLDYGSLGKFPTAAGTYLFDTSGVPTLIGPGVRLEGIVVDGVAVFTFDDIWVPSDVILNCVGISRPLALLSHRSVTVEGRISAGACGSEYGDGCSLGCGGNSPFESGPGGGGGFGGAGYGWGPNEGGYGGASHGDILVALQGGSSGGAGADFLGWPAYGGGTGGGALELGAVDTIAIRGPGIYADGGPGYKSGPDIFCTGEEYTGGGGGGSGGGILVHADTVALETRLSARGGYGGSGCGGPGGGGGGGGRIAITVGSGGFLNTGTVDVAGWWGQVGQFVLLRRENGRSFTVQAHTFGAGGQGCWQGPFYCGGAYFDETPGNWGDAQVRPGTDVDLWYDDDGIVIGGLDGLEWLTFPVTVPQSGRYTVTFRTASPADRPVGSGVVNVGVYGVTGSWIGNQTVPVTGGAGEWHTYVTWQAPTTIYLPAGAQTLTMWAAGGWYNVRSMKFTLTGSSP